MELLRTERLILREWEDSDAERLAGITSTEHIARWLPEWGACGGWALAWIQGTVRQGYRTEDPAEHFMTWAITLQGTNELVGMINLGSDEYGKREVGTGYFLDIRYENRGYMTEALRALCGYAFRRWQYPHIAATVHPENAASAAVLLKAGFVYDGEVMSGNGGFAQPVLHRLFRLPNPATRP